MLKRCKNLSIYVYLLRVGVFLSILICAAGCTNLLYAPDNHLYVNTEKLPIKPEQVDFSARVGDKVVTSAGWYFHASIEKLKVKQPKATIVYFHGNGQNRSAHFFGLYWLVNEGYDLFIFDYPGYGDVGGRPTPENTVAVGKAAIQWVQQKYSHLPLVVYGQSLGGAVAMRAVIELKSEGALMPKLVVADSTFLSYRGAARKVLSNHWLTWLLQPVGWLVMSDKHAPGERVKEISPVPLLVIHSKKDQVVDYSLGEEVFHAAFEPKEFWPLETGRHIETFSSADAKYSSQTRQKFLDYLQQVLK